MGINRFIPLILLFIIISNLVFAAALILLRGEIPKTPNKEFKIVAYSVPEPFAKGHIRIVIECENSGLQKEYYVEEGKFYFGGYLGNITVGVEGSNVGGISCTELPEEFLVNATKK